MNKKKRENNIAQNNRYIAQNELRVYSGGVQLEINGIS